MKIYTFISKSEIWQTHIDPRLGYIDIGPRMGFILLNNVTSLRVENKLMKNRKIDLYL